MTTTQQTLNATARTFGYNDLADIIDAHIYCNNVLWLDLDNAAHVQLANTLPDAAWKRAPR